MRLLIVGPLEGYITAAGKIALARGASVAHVDGVEQALTALRSGQGADLLLMDVKLDIGAMVAEPAPGAVRRSGRRLRRRRRCERRRARDQGRGQGISAAAARRRDDRGGAAGGRAGKPRPPLSRRRDGKPGEARRADRAVGRNRAHHRRKRHRQGGSGAPHPPQEPARASRISSRSIVPPFPTICSRASCSATKKAPSPAPSPAASASSKRRPAARCSSTR